MPYASTTQALVQEDPTKMKLSSVDQIAVRTKALFFFDSNRCW